MRSDAPLWFLSVDSLPISPAIDNKPKAMQSNAHATELVICNAQRRIQFICQDEQMQQRTQANTLQLIHTAVKGCNSSTSPTNTLLARKALKYRKLLQRVAEVDVADPSFDASGFLGVQWRKPECISV